MKSKVTSYNYKNGVKRLRIARTDWVIDGEYNSNYWQPNLIKTGQVGRGVGSSPVPGRAVRILHGVVKWDEPGKSLSNLVEMSQSGPFSDSFVELLKGKKG